MFTTDERRRTITRYLPREGMMFMTDKRRRAIARYLGRLGPLTPGSRGVLSRHAARVATLPPDVVRVEAARWAGMTSGAVRRSDKARVRSALSYVAALYRHVANADAHIELE